MGAVKPLSNAERAKRAHSSAVPAGMLWPPAGCSLSASRTVSWCALQQGLHARLAHLLKAPQATASGAAVGAGPGAPSASAASEGSPPGAGFAVQARSAPAAGASKFVTWRKRKAEEAAPAQSQGAKSARAGAVSAPGLAPGSVLAAVSDFGTTRPQVKACGDTAASGDAFGWDMGAAARRGPSATLADAAAGSSDAELEPEELSHVLGDAAEDTQGASPGRRSSGSAAHAGDEGAGTGSGAGPEGSVARAEAAGEGVQRDPGQCLVLVAEGSPMAGVPKSSFAISQIRHRSNLRSLSTR